ncbi:unnamed protein product [Allacma fusca]|uniref:Uncharacterized protein n=1 Tax=Allacma fusca TaxID=39272 RepID=A0A8J2PI20_9HEXA|nr:unnamed protein product [Allacma fusca]
MDQNVPSVKTQKLVFGVYILLAVFITTFYKAFLQSDVILETPYRTEWKYLQDMENFSLYFLLPNLNKCPTKDLPSRPNLTFCHMLEQDQRENPCQFFFELYTEHIILLTKLQEYSTSAYENKTIELFESLEANMFLVCLNEVQKILKEKSTKIAFVATESSFEFHWHILQRELEEISDPSINLGHNREAKDNFLVFPLSYFMTGGLNEYVQVVPKKMRSLLYSGIYELWTRWDAIRTLSYHQRKIIDYTRTIRPLGLYTSNLHLIFYFLAFAYAVTLLLALTEFVFGLFTRNNSSS